MAYIHPLKHLSQEILLWRLLQPPSPITKQLFYIITKHLQVQTGQESDYIDGKKKTFEELSVVFG